ncbi:hypothetical protein SmJEL517_g04824 [Synchytrium microbalum]|uniref:Sodium/hydrogen exchanger n=1 Tax=Synchytrium microbalum TaxID=1806994 RepID=A0A507BYS0_9FUNG|nr:uncharacterized protein SmJEL517_g04824 [Synchytrium microbalum]TPX31999.1 hypothetical protein SmJEL517_g04824 [Synchytrium microbalum]
MTNHTAEAEVISAEEAQHFLFVRALLMLGLIALSMNIVGFLKKKHIHYFGESAVLILVGLCVAAFWSLLQYDSENTAIQLSSKFFYMALLPPIIFEGGYTLQRVAFFKNILVIIALAFVGALYSTFICSILMYFFTKVTGNNWSFIESLVFGSLISSTDPVTVLSLLPSNVDKRLYMIIFGESALNDAVAIILYRFFTGFADPTMRLDFLPFCLSILNAAGVFLGSTLVGLGLAWVFAKITKHVKMDHEPAVYETVMLFVFAYSSYLAAEIMALTGIISIFFCGIGMAHYAHHNLEEEALTGVRITLRFLSFMSECFIFLYLGLGLLSFKSQATYNPSLIIFACISILVSRTHVFLILSTANLLPKHGKPVPWNQQVLVWFSGLRGAVAFALGVTFLEHPVFPDDVKGSIFGTTVFVVVVTILVLGGLTPYMLKWLKIIEPAVPNATIGAGHGEHEGVGGSEHHEAGKKSNEGYAELQDEENDDNDPVHHGDAPLFEWLHRMDATYIRPFFTNVPAKPDRRASQASRTSRTSKISLHRLSQASKRPASVLTSLPTVISQQSARVGRTDSPTLQNTPSTVDIVTEVTNSFKNKSDGAVAARVVAEPIQDDEDEGDASAGFSNFREDASLVKNSAMEDIELSPR